MTGCPQSLSPGDPGICRVQGAGHEAGCAGRCIIGAVRQPRGDGGVADYRIAGRYAIVSIGVERRCCRAVDAAPPVARGIDRSSGIV